MMLAALVALVMLLACGLVLWMAYCEAVRKTRDDPEETWLDTGDER